MKILCVTSNFPRWEGDSTTPFVLHLAEDLTGLGWQVDVLAPHAPGSATRETLNGINVTRFRYLFPEKAETVCYNGGALLNLRKRKSNYLKLPPLVCAEFFNVAKFLARGDYDLVHSHWILPQGFTCALASGIFGTPHVITIHGGDVFALQNNLLNRFKNYALKKCSAVTVNSSATRQKALELEPNLTELHQIPMGVATRKVPEGSKEVSRLRSLYRQGDGPLLVFVGRLVNEKGVEDLIRSVEILANHLPNVTTVIVGEGPDRNRFEDLTQKLNQDDRIFFTGWVNPESVPEYLTAADIFVGPSRKAADGWTEAQGLTFLEAMAVKTPVIATESGGITDTVKNNETGILVRECSPEDIAAAVQRLVSENSLYSELSQKAHEMVHSKFSRASSADAFSNLFKTLIEHTTYSHDSSFRK